MSDAITAIDLNKAANEMRERIRMAFVDMLTPDQFQGAVKAELDRFMNPKGGDGTFAGVCREELTKILRVQFKELVNKPDWTGASIYDNVTGKSSYAAGAAIQEFLVENGPTIVKSYLNEALGHILASFIQQARNSMARGY